MMKKGQIPKTCYNQHEFVKSANNSYLQGFGLIGNSIIASMKTVWNSISNKNKNNKKK